MAISKEKIDAVKHGVDLVALVQSRGIDLNKTGKGWFGRCPFHDDKTPSLSVNPDKNLWQCFGCGAAGDVIRFVELFDQVDFPEAVNRLSGSGLQAKKPKPKPTLDPPLSAKQKKLLTRVVTFYHTAFGEDPRAREYLETRGMTDKSVLSAHKAGFANGTLLNVLPVADPANGGDDGDLIDQLKELGILNQRGKEHFYGCATFPLYDGNGDPAGIYGRRIDPALPKGYAGTSEAATPGSARHPAHLQP